MTRLFFSALFFFVVYLQPTEVSLTMKRESQYTGPGHGDDAHVADRARLHARVYNCTTQLQRVVDNKSFDLVPSHAGEKKSQMQTPTAHESSNGRVARNSERVWE